MCFYSSSHRLFGISDHSLCLPPPGLKKTHHFSRLKRGGKGIWTDHLWQSFQTRKALGHCNVIWWEFRPCCCGGGAPPLTGGVQTLNPHPPESRPLWGKSFGPKGPALKAGSTVSVSVANGSLTVTVDEGVAQCGSRGPVTQGQGVQSASSRFSSLRPPSHPRGSFFFVVFRLPDAVPGS